MAGAGLRAAARFRGIARRQPLNRHRADMCAAPRRPTKRRLVSSEERRQQPVKPALDLNEDGAFLIELGGDSVKVGWAGDEQPKHEAQYIQKMIPSCDRGRG